MALLHELTLRLMIVLFISGDVDCLAGCFAVKSNLRQAADRTPPGDFGAYLISCATPISFALSEKFGIGSKRTETLSAPIMRTVSQLPLAHLVRRNLAANWLSQFDFFGARLR
jgi:hypothetical protein